MITVLFSLNAKAQLSGTKTIPGDYASIAAAVTDLNAQGVGAGGVTFNVSAGHTEGATAQVFLTATGTAGNPIVFQKSGAGANPLITRTDAGSNTTTTVGGLGDAIIRMDGSDYVTFNGIDVTASQSTIEYGYYINKQSATNACQNVTIQNAVITMNKATSAYVMGVYLANGTISTSSATGYVVSANSGRSENITIKGNTIQNVHIGIYCRGAVAAGFYDQNVVIGALGEGNTIRNFGGGNVSTTYGVYFIYTHNPQVVDNTINNASGGSPHASTLYGIFYSTVTGDVVGSNNTITMSNTATSATHWIYNAGTVTSNTFSNNMFGAGAFGSTTTSHLIYASSATNNVTIINNQTVGTITKTSASGTFYCYYSFGTPTGGLETITDNNFSNINTSGSSVTGGIYSNTAVGQSRICHSNVISNWTAGTGQTSPLYVLSTLSNQVYNNQVNNITAGGTLYGLYFSGTNPTVYNNEIHTLTSSGTILYGLWNAGTANTLCYNNKVYGLTNNNSASTSTNLLTGIYISTGTNQNVYNNLVGNLEMPNSISTDAIRGIYVNVTTASSNVIVSYNSVFMNASSSGSNFGTSGIFHTTSATATTGNLTLKNNLIFNSSTANGTGLTAAYRRTNATVANYNANSDRNMFWAGNASPTNLIYSDGTNSYDQLGDYQTFIAGPDGNSVTEDVMFQSTTGSSPNFLKFDEFTGSVLESGGLNIAGIDDDYAGTTRQGNVGYTGTGSAPDIGAWELEGTALSGCSGSPSASNALTTNATPCTGANFTLSLDQVFGVGYAFQWEESTTGPLSGFSPIGGATNSSYIANALQTTWYRSVVTCVTSAQSTTSGAVAVTITTLNGNYTIGAAGTYLDFGDAITDLNCKGASGHVTFTVADDEVFSGIVPLNLTYSGNPLATVTFVRSNTGTNRPKIQRSGTAATNEYIIKLTGVDYYTFNGIDLEQTGSDANSWVEYGVHIQNASASDGAKNNTFKNGIITLSNSNVNSKGVYIQSSPTPTSLLGTNSDNKFINTRISNSFEGYRITGATSTYMDDGNEINNEFGGFSDIEFLGNGSVAGSVYGVFATYQTNLLINNTSIGNLNPSGTSLAYGFTMQTSANNSATISNSYFHDISGVGTTYGIHASAGATLNLLNNTVTGISTTGATSAVRGILLTATGLNANIDGNRIYNISSSTVSTGTAAGIDVATGLVYNISNNMISDLRAPASTTTTGGTRGISVSSGSTGGVVKIYYNTIAMSDVATVAGYTSAGIHNSSTTPTLDLRNNIVVNRSDISGAGLRVAAFWKTATTDNVDNNSDNNLYYAGSPDASHLIYYDGTNAAQSVSAYNSLAAISPGEALSQTEDILFDPINNGTIRPDASTATVAESGGQNIAGYTIDFENDSRTGYPLGGQSNGGGFAPDMGADEGDFTFYVQPVPDCASLNSPADLTTNVCQYNSVELKWSAPTGGGTVTGGYDVYFGTNPSPAFLLNTNNLSHTVATVTGNTTYYWQVVPKGNSGDATGCPIYSFTTSNSEITGVTNDTRCGTGVVNLAASSTATVNWYTSSTGGNSIFTGTNYSPVVNASTNFYVGASQGLNSETVGRSETTAGTSATSASTYGLVFNATTPMTIDYVTIILGATTGGTLVVQIRDSLAGSTGPGTNIIGSVNVSVPTGTIGQRVQVPIGLSVPAGNGYRLLAISSPSLVRTTTGSTYPYISSGGSVSITSGFITNSGSLTYYYFYDWVVSTICESPRTLVTATVTPADPINVTPSSATICDNTSTNLTASSTYAYNYTWSPGTGLNTTVGASVTANPATTTTYTVTGDDGVCANQQTVTVTVNPSPIVTAIASQTTICAGASTSLSATVSAATPVILLSEGFNAGLGAWTTENLSTFNPSAAEWTPQTSPYLYSSINYSSNDASVFLVSNSDAQGSTGSTTLTRLTSPAINLSGYSSVNLSFYHYYRYNNSPETAKVLVSIDGVVWTPIQTYITTQGAPTIFANANLNLNAYIGNPSVQIRFEYDATDDWYWMLDNVLVTGVAPHTFSWTSSPAGFTSSVQNPGTVSPAVNTTYTLEVTSSQGCIKTSDVAVTVNPLPTASVGSNSPVCEGASINLTSSGGGTYSWTGPNGFTSSAQNPVISGATSAEAGLYEVTVTVNGCTDMASVNVVVNNCQVPCVTPTSLSTTNITGSEARLNWNSNVTGDAFLIKYWETAAAIPAAYYYTSVSGPNPVNFVDIANLIPATNYSWIVKTVCNTGNYSPYSAVETFTTLNQPQACGRPLEQGISNLTATSAQLNWIPMNANAFQIKVTETTSGLSKWFGISGANLSYGAMTGLTPGTDYQAMVLAHCGAPTGTSRYSSLVNFTTPAAAPGSLPCSTPYDVRAINITPTSATIEWNAATTADQFRIRYAVDNGLFNWTFKTFSGTPSVTMANLTGLTDATNYIAQVQSICASPASKSVFSAYATFTTGATPRLITEGLSSVKNILVYPNPTDAYATMQFNAEISGAYLLQISDIVGRVITENTGNASEGMNMLNLDLSMYNKGIYLVTLKLADQTVTTKVVVQ